MWCCVCRAFVFSSSQVLDGSAPLKPYGFDKGCKHAYIQLGGTDHIQLGGSDHIQLGGTDSILVGIGPVLQIDLLGDKGVASCCFCYAMKSHMQSVIR